MSKLIVNEIEKYDAGQLTITTGTDVSIGSDLTVGGAIAGTLSTAAQTNITSVGTLSSLAVSGNLTVDINTLFVDAANNRVGLGTSSPTSKLTINAPQNSTILNVVGGIANREFQLRKFDDGLGSNLRYDINHQWVSGIFSFSINDTERMRIDASGNVGIGTSSPSKKLDVFTNVNASNEYQLSLRNGSSGTGVSTGIAFGFNSTALDPDYLANIFSVITNRTTRSADIIFSTASAATPTERVRVISTGLSFPNGNGIDFSASAGGGATSSLLDDYEEGTFTVTTDGDSTGALVSETGEYTKVGNIVHVRITFRVGTSFSDNRIAGLPFVPNGSTAVSGIASAGFCLTTSVNDSPLFSQVNIGDDKVRFLSGTNVSSNHNPSTTNLDYRVYLSYLIV